MKTHRSFRFRFCRPICLAVLWVGLPRIAAADSPTGPACESEVFGRLPDQREVRRFSLDNGAGLRVQVMEYGATITGIFVPDRNRRVTNVILGSDRFEDYLAGRVPAASVIGRFANRIAGARFTLDGTTYTLAANSGTNHIHGGPQGFAKRLWQGEALPRSEDGVVGVRFTYRSADGEEGYPGNLVVSVSLLLTPRGELQLQYAASTDRPTVVNLTNHAYFNLAGGGDVMNHELWLAAEQYTPTDASLIPTGATATVVGTPLDFLETTRLGARMDRLPPPYTGYDHNFVLGDPTPRPRLVARLRDPAGGRTMEVLTTEPGVQLYTGNHVQHRGVCLETQHYPDSPNQPAFPSCVVRPGAPFESETVFRFKVR